MHRLVVPLLLLSLACGGLPATGPGSGWPDVQGRWCAEDPTVGCYRFEGSVVHEEAVKLKRGTYAAAQGDWNFEGDDLLLMRFPNGTWTLQRIQTTENLMILRDNEQGHTYNFVRQQD